MNRVKRYWLGGIGAVMFVSAPPLELVSHLAYFVLWYAGWVLWGVWLLLDIRASRRR